MRKYTIPQSMVVEYFLGDHPGSTSITTDNAGAKVSEMRYKPFAHSAVAFPFSFTSFRIRVRVAATPPSLCFGCTS